MPKEFISAWTGIPKAKHYGASAPELTLQLSLDCDPQQAEALAQFVKRVTWGAMRDCAVDDSECYVIRASIFALGRALAEAGYAPR
jgi:hypothetical protein